MLAKGPVEKTLGALDSRYRAAGTAEEAQLYAKLAILELAGWTEEAIDDIVRRIAKRRLRRVDNRQFVDARIVGRTYGFDYVNHVREMFCRTIGIVGVEKLESAVDAGIHLKLKGALGLLKKARDPLAHTHISGTTPQLDAPSLTRARLGDVYKGLKDLARTARSLGF